MLACPECRKLHPSDATHCSEHRCALVPLESLPAERDETLEPGVMVGEYRIERKLGSGTFGAVYAGEQPLIGKKVAIKVLHAKFASDAGVVSRFVSEARAVNRIGHHNIIDIFSFGVLGHDHPYFVMELLQGMTLRELLDREGRISVAEAIPILRGIADGLDAAHEAGITHRDLKPDNIFLAAQKGGGYFPKLLDFGVAKLVADDVQHKTATGAAIGTPSYMAPEQCRGKAIDHRADVYALAVVIHEMLTGHRLFQADSAMDVLLKHVSEPPRPMSEICSDLPAALDTPVLAMLAKDPKRRPSSAGEAIAAIAERAKESGADKIAVDAGPSSFQRALARREASTIVTGVVAQEKPPTSSQRRAAQSADAAAPSSKEPRLEGSGDSSGPVVISVGDGATRQSDPVPVAASPSLPAPATTEDGRFAISSKGGKIKVWDLRTGQAVHTFQGQVGADDASIVPETIVPESRPAASSKQDAPKRAGSSRTWALIAAGAAVLAAFVLMQRARGTGTTAATPSSLTTAPAPEMTLRLAITPPDADVFLDGVRVGKASERLVVSRSEHGRTLRVEKIGYEAQTLVLPPGSENDLPPIALRPALGTPPTTKP